jgi:protein-tyrosine-phosphatase
LADALEHGIRWREVPIYIAVQCLGGIVGTALAHAMFDLQLFSKSQHARSGPAQFISEFVATFGLLSVIWGCSRLRQSSVPFAVGAYITAAYWFTASTSFANPAVTIARTLTNTFSGIRPGDAPMFIAAQLAGAIIATGLFRWLIPSLPATAKEIIMPHDGSEIKSAKTYLFACVHNAGRSQMAAAFFNIYADMNRCKGLSAGTQPADHIHPEVVQVMKEIGIDISSRQPQRLTDDLARAASVLVTMGCGEACPFIPGLRVLNWSLPDPKGQSLDDVRAIRDDIHEKIKYLIKSECAECCAI